jgi:hypothetical protein
MPSFHVLSSVEAAKAEVFYFNELIYAVMRTLRPNPDSLTPPNGATSFEIRPVLMPTIPHSSASAARQMRPISRL